MPPVPLPIPLDFEPMEAEAVAALPAGADWWFEPKWDGFRCLAFHDSEHVELRSRSGRTLSRYFPDVVRALAAAAGPFVIDGELTIAIDGRLSFDALQLRLHPAASRVEKLARAHPALLIAFDCLADRAGRSLAEEPLAARRAALERLAPDLPVRLTPGTANLRTARRWLARAGGDLDGVVAKHWDGPYAAGQRAMLKVKLWRSADCVVGGFRRLRQGEGVGALLLGLYDEVGALHHVGFLAAITDAERPRLTRRLEAIAGEGGFAGEGPGGPSRWNRGRPQPWTPVRPELVVEVRYDHLAGDRFRHGASFVRWRPDKPPDQCRLDQLRREAAPARLLAELAV